MKILLALLFLIVPAYAQESRPYAPPEQELWQQMITALQGVSMPLQAHQQVQQILRAIEQQAMQQQMRKKPEPAK
jgi:hypothetical protein